MHETAHPADEWLQAATWFVTACSPRPQQAAKFTFQVEWLLVPIPAHVVDVELLVYERARHHALSVTRAHLARGPRSYIQMSSGSRLDGSVVACTVAFSTAAGFDATDGEYMPIPRASAPDRHNAYGLP